MAKSDDEKRCPMNRRLKILFLTNRSPLPIKDGQSRRTYNILKGLSEKHDVFLLSLYEAKEETDPKNIADLKSFCKDVELHPAPSKKPSLPMVSRLLVSLFSPHPYTVWRHYSRPYVNRIHELTCALEFDIVHCDTLPISYALRDVDGKTCTLTDHDVSYLKALRTAKSHRNPLVALFLFIEAFKLKRLESSIFETVTTGFAVSELDKSLLQRICPKGRFEVIQNGVDSDTFRPRPEKTEPNKLLWVGGFSHYANEEAVCFFLQNIYPLLKKGLDGIRLDLVGGGVTKGIRKLASRDTSIRILGYVPDPIPYIQASTIFVAPVLSGGGTRLKLLEAMAMGKAIVTTSIGCEGIGGLHREHYLVADTARSFAECVFELYEDEKFRRHLGHNARGLIEKKYDWKVICQEMNTIYWKLAQIS